MLSFYHQLMKMENIASESETDSSCIESGLFTPELVHCAADVGFTLQSTYGFLVKKIRTYYAGVQIFENSIGEHHDELS